MGGVWVKLQLWVHFFFVSFLRDVFLGKDFFKIIFIHWGANVRSMKNSASKDMIINAETVNVKEHKQHL